MPLHYVNPNYHVILIHYPLGVFVLGVILEVFCLFWRKSSVRIAAAWMILLGAFLSLPAVTSGIYALYEVLENQGITGERYQLLRMHVWVQSGATLLAVLCAVIGLGANDSMRQKLRIPLLIGCLFAVGGMVYGSWTGGETVYRNGTSVQLIDEDGNLRKVPKVEDAYKDDDKEKAQYNLAVNYYMGGVKQLHFIGAGFVLAVIAAALGLSIRRWSTFAIKEVAPAGQRQSQSQQPLGKRRGADDLSVVRTLNPEADLEPASRAVPVGIWWTLAILVTVATAAGGYWLVSGRHVTSIDKWNEFVSDLALNDAQKGQINRHLAHAGLGALMLILAFIMLIVSKAMPRQGLIMSLFALLLVLAVSAQVWVGIALAFDENGSSLYKFDGEDSKPAGTTQPSTRPSPQDAAPAATQASPDSQPAPAAAPVETPATAPA